MAVIIERYNYELNLNGVPDQPWPVSLAGGSVSVSGSAPANGLTGSPVPTYADYIGARNGAGNLAGVAFGQQAMAASLPVTLASDQPAIPVSGSLALSGAVDQGAAGVDPWPVTVSGSLPLPTNAAAETGGNLAAAAAVLGTTTDATVQGDNPGTINARLRGISVVLNSVWDSVNNWFKVSIQNATLAVTQSGSWVLSAGSALIGKVGIDQTTPGTTNAVHATNLPTTVDTNAGAASASTPRTILASNDPAVAALQVMDDWDESDRAKVNLIVGQAGIAGGTGTDGATVPRVTLATNVPLPAGTNNIGDVDVLSLPATPAGTNLIGRVSASQETGTIYVGTTALTPKFAKIDASTNGNNTLVAAVASNKIRVLAYNFVANGSVNAKFQSGASGTDLTGLKYCVANMGICAPFNPVGWFETGVNTLLNLNLSAAIAVGGELVYVEVP